MKATTLPSEQQIPLAQRQYVDAKQLLEILFDESTRPSLRWVRDQQRNRTLPFVKLGRLCFFDPHLVKLHLDSKFRCVVRKSP